jgi:uncharacterized RDD family membrane protein YckC
LFNKQSTLPERGGFWRRLGAFFVDALIIAVGLQLLGIPAYTITGGRAQANIFRHAVCHSLTAVPPDLRIPSEFKPNYVYECVNTWFGLPTGRWITVSRQSQPQAGDNMEVTFPIDAEGHPLGSVSLDLSWLQILVLLVYRIIFERRSGQTIGKRLMRVRVIEIQPGSGRFSPAAKRNLAFLLPGLFPAIFPVSAFDPIGPLFWLRIIGGGFVCAVIVWQITTRRDTYYDKVAGTAVIRTRAYLPPVAVRAPAA